MNLGITEGVAALVPEPVIQLGVRIVALILLGAIPFVALTVLYRRGSDERSSATSRAGEPPSPSRRGRRISLVVPLVLCVARGPAATAANAEPATTVTLTQFSGRRSARTSG